MQFRPRIVIYNDDVHYIYTRYKSVRRYYIYFKNKLILKVEWVEEA